jgi:hypothetical protein
MIGKWLSVSEIAELTGTTNRWTQKRAIREHWPSRNEKANGGIRRICQVAALPADVQTACAESLKLGLTGLQSQLKPSLQHKKKGNPCQPQRPRRWKRQARQSGGPLPFGQRRFAHGTVRD